MDRRHFLQSSLGSVLAASAIDAHGKKPDRPPILVAVELSGGNDGLNTVVPYGDDAYYRQRPSLGIAASDLFRLDDHFGLNPGLLGLHRLWQKGQLAIVHGCGYDNPSYSHFTSMAYWHTGAPNRGDALGWMGRLADEMAPQRQDNMLINIGSSQSLAVRSAVHTPLVFNDPARFQRSRWLPDQAAPTDAFGYKAATKVPSGAMPNPARSFLHDVHSSAQSSAREIRGAWQSFKTPVDYGIAPMDLPKVTACIQAGLPTQLYYVAFQNNAFDTHVNQPALHTRLLSYASDGIYGFIKDLERIGQADRVLVMVFSEFGRRVAENANLGTDHGTANVMFLAGAGVQGGHYGRPPSLTELVDGGNLRHTVDFRQVYATAMQSWMGIEATGILRQSFTPLPVL
ncbi:MAG: DUF1501 domain-containing protein [Burkholderiaceae bacterium]